MTETQSNVRQIADKQPQPAAKFTITATLDGFPFTVEAEGKASDLRALVDRLRAIGAEPPAAVVQASAQTAQVSTPVCPEHGTAKPSKKPGTYYCPKSLPDDGYCRWTGKA